MAYPTQWKRGCTCDRAVTNTVVQYKKRPADKGERPAERRTTCQQCEMEVLKMMEEMKLLNAEELEMVSGGTIDWRHFSEEVREASERGDV